MGSSVEIECAHPECSNMVELRFRRKNRSGKGIYCSTECYRTWSPKMDEVYKEWALKLNDWKTPPLVFMKSLLLRINSKFQTWEKRAQILGLSRLTYVNWSRKFGIGDGE